jgi:hypothetical protein
VGSGALVLRVSRQGKVCKQLYARKRYVIALLSVIGRGVSELITDTRIYFAAGFLAYALFWVVGYTYATAKKSLDVASS